VKGVTQCSRGCFGPKDHISVCGSGTPKLDACAWQVSLMPELGDTCVGAGMGVNSTLLYTQWTSVLDETWGTQVIEVTSGSYDASSFSAQLTCAPGTMAGSGTLTTAWNGSLFVGTYAFDSTCGNVSIGPGW
jgi:hypothetical protein